MSVNEPGLFLSPFLKGMSSVVIFLEKEFCGFYQPQRGWAFQRGLGEHSDAQDNPNPNQALSPGWA